MKHLKSINVLLTKFYARAELGVKYEFMELHSLHTHTLAIGMSLLPRINRSIVNMCEQPMD